MQNSQCSTNWHPCNYLQPDKACASYGILVLNAFLSPDVTASSIVNMWNNALVRITVDGGTNRWLHWLKENNITNALEIDLITGDMDSIKPELLAHYERQPSTTVIRTPDQNETDFTKSLRELKKYLIQHDKQIELLIVLDATTGRIDQIMANINTLYKATLQNILPDVKVIKMSSHALTWLLAKGKHRISVPEAAIKYQKWCSLMPIGGPSVVTSTGLKWDLNKTTLKFGTLISTSNTYNGDDTVYIETDSPILWSMDIKYLRN